MKAKELRNMSAEELQSKLLDLKKDLFNLRMQHATNQLDNPLRIADLKRYLRANGIEMRMQEPAGAQ